MMNVEPRVAILQDLRIQSFDAIRFASYRTASKLRYIQKSTNLHLVDIWNVIEAFRENGLNTLEPQSEVSVSRLETLVSSLYHNLNKRLPTAQQVPAESKAGLLLNWLIAAYTNATTNASGKIRVFSIKVALATMCAGKLVDKLRYIFSQISDGAGQLIHWKLSEFLREILAMPAAVYESPTFHYTDGLEAELFSLDAKVSVNDFIGTLVTEPGPPCLVWLPLLQRLATVESIVHPTVCSVCRRENFTGFRYRCQRCHAYQLCQDCFWHGRVSLGHQNDHEVKEYTSYKSPSKQIGHSLRKSFRCVPEKPNHVLPRFPEQPEKTLNLSHIVPPSPLPSHNGFVGDPMMMGPNAGAGGILFDRSSTLDSRATGRSGDSGGANQAAGANGGRASSLTRPGSASNNDEEHRLIANYAARLAQESSLRGGSAPPGQAQPNGANAAHMQQQQQQQQQHQQMAGVDGTAGGLNGMPLVPDNSLEQRALIAQLESKNKEIMREIARLRRQQEQEALSAAQQQQEQSPALMVELRALRQRKGELEGHLGALQDSRRQLMVQLEGLMRMLKNQQQTAAAAAAATAAASSSGATTISPRSTPNSSPRSGKSPPMPSMSLGGGSQQQSNLHGRIGLHQQQPMHLQQQQQQQHPHQQSHLNGPYQQQQQQPPHLAGYAHPNGAAGASGNGGMNAQTTSQTDVLYVADSVTSAMSSLVDDLNSDFDESKVFQQDWDQMKHHHQQQQQQHQPMSAASEWEKQFAQWNLNPQKQ